MTDIYRVIDKYKIQQVGDGSLGVLKIRAYIDCYAENGENFAGIVFTSPDALSKPTYAPSIKKFQVWFDIQRFSEVISTLRYEMPVFLKYTLADDSSVSGGVITTGSEHVGEQEGEGQHLV